MSSESSNVKDRVSIGRIPLKQVRVSRSDKEAKEEKEPAVNPMNRLVPYLDLFTRLGDGELARLAGVDEEVCATLRAQVVTITEGLAAYADLLPRLSDRELVRLTGATDKTIRFWRLCQPRDGSKANARPNVAQPAPGRRETTGGHAAVPHASESGSRMPTAPHSPVAAQGADTTTGRFPSSEALGQSAADSQNAGFVELSGAPFPGFEQESGGSGGASAPAPALDSVSLTDVDGATDPLGLAD